MGDNITAFPSISDRDEERLLAIVVHQYADARTKHQALVDELVLLVNSAGADVVEKFICVRRSAVAATYIGKGRLDDLKQLVDQYQANLVIFNNKLSPVQERNLEKALQTRVLDRTSLILDIFAQRAASHEGKLQVELAQLKHLSTRLIRGWTHLERQKGGIGLRGPGETQLETDRRLIGARIRTLQQRLKKVHSHRQLQRRARTRVPIPTISLVGYTNAGKSTIFNRLTNADVYVADKLFATLDPTMRKLELPKTGFVILSDTVGFISDLPHSLVAAFHSTLEEVASAQVLLHVIDASNPEYDTQVTHVDDVLQDIQAGDVPVIMVYNKIDQTQLTPGYEPAQGGRPAKVWLSAKTGQGEGYLLAAISDYFLSKQIQVTVKLPPQAANVRAVLYQKSWVQNESHQEDGWNILELSLEQTEFDWLRKQEMFYECKIITAISCD